MFLSIQSADFKCVIVLTGPLADPVGSLVARTEQPWANSFCQCSGGIAKILIVLFRFIG